MMQFRKLAILSLCYAVFVTVLSPARAQEVSFKGKQVTIYVGFSPTSGIGYDTYARTLARHYAKHIPGHPQIIVQNVPAGGGMVAANNTFNISPRDGTALGVVKRMISALPKE